MAEATEAPGGGGWRRYAVEQRIAPATRREAEVRSLLVQWARNWQTHLVPAALLETLFAEESGYVALALAEDLAALERLHWSQSDVGQPWEPAGSRGELEQLGHVGHVGHVGQWEPGARPLLRAPVNRAVFRCVLPGVARSAPPAARAYRLLLHGFPSLAAEARGGALMEELVHDGADHGLDASLWQPVFNGDAPELLACLYLPSLGACEQYTREPAVRARLQTLREISRAPLRQELAEVIVPLPL